MERSTPGTRVCVLAAIMGSAIALPATAVAQFVEPDVRVLYTLRSDAPGDGFGFVADAGCSRCCAARR